MNIIGLYPFLTLKEVLVLEKKLQRVRLVLRFAEGTFLPQATRYNRFFQQFR
jgi:hypothetical protein